MLAFSNSVAKIKISFDCDLCGVETTLLADIPPSGDVTLSATCPVCYKEFDVTICRGAGANDSTVFVSDISDDNIKITIIDN